MYCESSSLADFTLDINCTVMPLNDLIADRKPQPGTGSGLFCRKERLEDPVHVLFGNTAARIAHSYGYVIIFCSCRDPDHSLLLYGMSRIHQKIQEYLPKLLRITIYGRQISQILLQGDLILKLVPGDAYRPFKTLIQIGRFHLFKISTGKALQILDYRPDPDCAIVRLSYQCRDIIKQIIYLQPFSGFDKLLRRRRIGNSLENLILNGNELPEPLCIFA